MDEAEWLPLIRQFAIDDMMQSIKSDLERLNIHMDRFSSEHQLVTDGAVDAAMNTLTDKGLIYQGVLEKPKAGNADEWEPREQMLFRSTDFGDDVDRAVKKSDGSWTYFASDIAYHLDKLNRGSDTLINIWGADHGGYVKRMKSAVSAFTGNKDSLNIQLVQLVKLMDGGQQVKMSKRAGTFVTLSDVLDAVGRDILRFIMLTRRADQTMDFDYAEVTTQSRENPVFYVQYAHARASSVLRQDEVAQINMADADLGLLTDSNEMALIRQLASFPRQVEAAGQAFEPHRIAFYLMDLAASFHGLWNKGRDDASLRFITDDPKLTAARLKLVDATAVVIRNGFAILGVEAIKEM
jgi:arginyl-tRNA synthetase